MDIVDVGFKKSAATETLYEGGAQRDSRSGKGAPEWVPSQALSLVSCVYEVGNKGRSKTGNGDDRNWENGMKIGDLLGSAIRHIERYKEGDRSEPHLPQAIWNTLNALQMAIWVSTGYRSQSFNNLADHIHPWKPGDPPPPALSMREIEWLKLRGIHVNTAHQLTAPYLAAMVDAKGSISIVKQANKEVFYVRVAIYSTSKQLLDTIQSRFGGTLIAKKKTDKHADSWGLIWVSTSAADIIKLIAPLLVVRSKSAEIALKFNDLVSNPNYVHGDFSDSILNQIRSMKEEINTLNLNDKSDQEVGF